MSRMLSAQSQCCCCSASVFSALFGTIMAATGISLVLNYRITEVDTGGLPPELQNDEGKKIVGIILICCGFGSMGISALIATVYFTVCSRPKVRQAPDKAATKSEAPTSQAAPQHTDPYSQELPHRKKDSNSRHGKRQKKRNAHLKQYKNRLPAHPEVTYESESKHVQISLTESPRSLDSSQTDSSKTTSTSTQGELPDIFFQKTVSGDPPVHIRIQEASPERPRRDTNYQDNGGREPPQLYSKVISDPGIPRDSAVVAEPSELPAFSSVHKEEEEVQEEKEEEEEVSQIEEVKQLDRDVLGHMVS